MEKWAEWSRSWAQQKGWEILAALDGQDAKLLRQLKKADAAVDFSHPAMLDPLANYIRRTGTPLISGTTGYSEEQMDVLRQLGKSAAVLYSANYSLGVAFCGGYWKILGRCCWQILMWNW